MLNLLRFLFFLAAAACTQTGCASSNSDLGYTPGADTAKPGDSSYHGWNSANQ